MSHFVVSTLNGGVAMVSTNSSSMFIDTSIVVAVLFFWFKLAI